MVRYLRLYAYFLRFAVSRSLEFRLDFWFRVVMDTFYYIINISFYKIIFLHSPSLGGWTEAQMMVFVSAYLLVDALQMTLFSSNMWMLPLSINKGDLDYYLVRPVSALFFLSLRDFSLNSFINVIFATGIAIWALLNYPETLSFLQIFLFIAGIGVGTLIFYTVYMFFIIPVFWTHSSRGFGDLFWPTTRFMERPDTIYKGWLRRILLSIMPMCLIASFPSRLLFNGWQWDIALYMLVVTAIIFRLMLSFWDFGLKHYSSASS